jgi:hypothetical protein
MRGVLHTLVRFLMPASYAVLEALLVGSAKACGSAQELDLALTELEDRGLIGWDRETNRYDAHPIVRGVVWQRTDSGDQRAVYTALEAHLEPMVTPEWDQIETLADLTPAIERYHTLVGLKRYEDAFALFCDRLDDATLYRLAAHQERIAWLERLFPDGAAGLPALKNGMIGVTCSTRWLRAMTSLINRPERFLFLSELTKRESFQVTSSSARFTFQISVKGFSKLAPCARQLAYCVRRWRSVVYWRRNFLKASLFVCWASC